MNKPPILKSALIAGAAFGVAGGMPFLGLLNCLCCALAIGSGLVAAYLYSNECKSVGCEFSGGAGAKLGALTSLFYSLSHLIVGGLAQLFSEKPGAIDMLEQLESSPGMTPEGMDLMEKLVPIMLGPAGVLIIAALVIVAALIFCTIGGLIGGSVFKVAAEEPPPPLDAGDDPQPGV